ncbi:phage tail length tape measure family protein [Ideonella dechloratans]|uniref:phage tail length tape measure family protein n=1 Tax=Ideonella dechloratans TaxID=36863 RepID=UPI0035B06591
MTAIASEVRLDTTGATASITNFANATDAQLKRIARAYETVAREQARANKLQAEANALARGEATGTKAAEGMQRAARAAADHGKAVADATEKVHTFNLASAGTTRELLVLTHELSQGNYKRFGGSLLVLAEQMRLGTLIFSATGVALLGVGAAAAFVGMSFVHGVEQQAEFNKNLVLTGNYAGLTAGKLDELTAAQARATHSTLSSSREALMAAQGTGAFSPQTIALAGEAIQRLSHLTGEETSKIAGDFAAMQNGVAKWAEEHNRSMHFLSSAQYSAIRSLEETGHAEEAQKIVLTALDNQLKESEKNLGGFARAWQNLKNAIDGARDSIASAARETPFDKLYSSAEKQVALIKSQIEINKQSLKENGTSPYPQAASQLSAAEALLARLAQSKKLAEDVAKATADADRRQAEGIAGADSIKRLSQEVDRRTELERKIQEYRTAAQKMRDAGDPNAPTESQQAAWEALARAKWQNPGDRKMTNEAEALAKSLADGTAKVREQTAELLKYGKVLDNAHEAETRFRLSAQGDLKVSPAQGARLIGLAQQADAAEAAKRQAEHEAQVRKNVDAYKELAAARELSARDAYIQQQVETRVGAAITQTTQTLKDFAAVVATRAGTDYDRTQAEKFAKDAATRQLAVAKEIDAINRQNEGLFQSTLAREKAADAAKLQASAAEEIIKYPEREAEILKRLTQDLQRVAAAREKQYAQSRTPTAGVAQASTKWYEDATNGAAIAERMTTTAFDQMTAAVQRFAQTGKLSFRSLWSAMASEYLAAVARMAVAKLFGSVGSGAGLLGLLGLAGGGAGAAAASGSVLDAGVTSMVGFAAEGGHISTGSPFVVGEKGPELFVPTGSGDVIPNDQLGGGGGPVFHIGQGQVIQVGQGVSRSEVASAVAEGNARTLAHVQRLSRTGRLTRG